MVAGGHVGFSDSSGRVEFFSLFVIWLSVRCVWRCGGRQCCLENNVQPKVTFPDSCEGTLNGLRGLSGRQWLDQTEMILTLEVEPDPVGCLALRAVARYPECFMWSCF